METQPTLPSLAVSIVADVAGYKRTMTCRNGRWDGYDLNHPFFDDRSTALRRPSVQTTIEQEATLRIPLANVPMPHLLERSLLEAGINQPFNDIPIACQHSGEPEDSQTN